MWLPFQNSIEDFGRNPLNWSVQSSRSEQYEKGIFGNAYKFVSPSNAILTSNYTNPYGIVNEFSMACVFKKGRADEDVTAFPLIDVGAKFNSSVNSVNYGIVLHVADSGKLLLRVEQGTASGGYGSNLGRWDTDFSPVLGKEYLCVVTRTNTYAYCLIYNYTDKEKYENSLSYSGTNLDNWDSRPNSVGGLYTRDSTTLIARQAISGGINSALVYDKALSHSDCQRFIHNLHPLNG